MEQRAAAIAVLTPVYNRPAELARGAASVLGGLRPGDSYVVVDDGSTVPVSLADSRAVVVRHEANRGLLAARNTSLRAIPADADWVLFLDSDDALVDGWRELVESALPAAPILFFDRGVDGSRRLGGRVAQPGGRVTLDSLLSGAVRGDFVIVARAELVEGFEWDEAAWGFEGVLWARIVREHPGRHVPQVLASGPPTGARRDSASTRTDDPIRSRAMARGAEGFRREFAAELTDRFPRSDADLALTELTWRLIADDATVSDTLALRSMAFANGYGARWARLTAFAALPAAVRRRILSRRVGRR